MKRENVERKKKIMIEKVKRRKEAYFKKEEG